jgi:pseudouridine-5'-phosphate glycosidase
MKFNFNEEVSAAFHFENAAVALESTVIAHGLPRPQNLETAKRLEQIVRDNGAAPATIAIFNGDVQVGLHEDQLNSLAASDDIRKISRRDLSIAVAKKLNCATTVATTAFLAHRAGIKVFATGGIGGVHRGDRTDVSADLPELAQTPITVVCSGAKIVLDLPATREWLETNGVTVLGWKCDEMPAFYSRKSGLAVDERVDSAAEAVKIIKVRDELKLKNSVLITVPVPEEAAMESAEVESILKQALAAAHKSSIRGKDLTPFLLTEMSRQSGGKTLEANIALLENNARVAAEIASALYS